MGHSVRLAQQRLVHQLLLNLALQLLLLLHPALQLLLLHLTLQQQEQQLHPALQQQAQQQHLTLLLLLAL